MFAGGFDNWVDQRAERWRGRPAPDAAARLASALGDHGLVWFLVLVARSRRPGRARQSALRAVAFTGVVVPAVNAGIKAMVGRPRPDDPDAHRGLRPPRTTSFPSGHSLAAWCAATLLAEDDPAGAWWYGLAAAVSLSRVHVRHHHASDVVAGSLLGVALGRLGRRLVPLRSGASLRGTECRHRTRALHRT